MSSETRLIWQAAGAPAPCDSSWEEIPRRRHAGHCARCGGPDAAYALDELISANFVPTRNANRLHGYGGDCYCAACVFCARTLRLRCISWFASEGGVRFWRTRPDQKNGPRPDALGVLLEPPAPPFVVGLPLYGIAHGGEAHWQRTWWPGDAKPDKPLVRLQSKHVALYSRIAMSRDRYPVQVDDVGEFVLDRDVWLRAHDCAAALVQRLVDAGTRPFFARQSLLSLTPPRLTSVAVARDWQRLSAPLRGHAGAVWWSTFCLLLEIKGENDDATTDERIEAC